MLQFLKKVTFFFCIALGFSQELPPINNFTPLSYNGGNQNWSIAQSSKNYIYVANNFGLLEYNGAFWKTYPSPNGSNIRTVKVINDTIFTGCYMELGFWEKDSFGDLNYQSLKPNLTIPMIEDEEFWNIVQLDKWILFQSLQRIYVYNTEDKSFNVIASESKRARIFKNNGVIYFQQSNKGLFKIEGGKGVLVSDDAVFKNNVIIDLFEGENESIVVTEKSGFYTLTDTQLTRWQIPINEQLLGVNLYSSLQLNDKSFILGTISDGLYYVDASGNFIRKINQQMGLYDNTVHSVFEDVKSNIWLALNNGISVINLNSPFNEYIDKIGKLGVVYTAAVYKDNLYLGTNQGLFYKNRNSNEAFKIIENTNGQVWFLKELDGVLFCGHNDGTFVVNENKVTLISNLSGTWDIKKIPGVDSLLLQGNYKGLSVLKKVNGAWGLSNPIEGFEISSRFFEFTANKDIIVNHEYRGLFRLTLNPEFSKVIKVVDKPVMGSGASLVTYKDTIFYTSNNGVFRYMEAKNQFKLDSLFRSLFFYEEEQPIGIIVSDEQKNLLWAFTNKNIISVAPNKFNGKPEAQKIAIPNFFRGGIGVQGFENITRIAKNKYLIGISNGYITLDLNKVKTYNYEVALTRIFNKKVDSSGSLKVPLYNEENEFSFQENNLYFEYSVPNFEKYAEVNYQYQLNGLNAVWSDWTSDAKVSFENLPFGNYTFNVKAKIGNNPSDNIASFSFEIRRPWYFTNIAWSLYVLLFVVIGYAIHRLYRGYYSRQQELLVKANKRKLKQKKIKTEKKLIQITNEKLNQEIESKSRELAISTMSIIKKNEFLNALKIELQERENDREIKTVIKTIDRNINNEDDWKFFEDAFNNADKDFLKMIKKIHPELKPNDLRLCAYLRLNLSSKEVAPLLNISVRSVEVKRYRLRKKMNLPHESNLADYILNL